MSRRMQRLGALALGSTLAVAGIVIGCGDPGSPPASGVVALNFATKPALAAKAAPRQALISGSETFAIGGDTLVVTKVELVLKHVKFEALGDSVACDDSTGGDEDCHELVAGPFLADLPLGGGVARQFSVTVQPGTYGELDFQIHAAANGTGDGGFLAAHPDLRGVSVRVSGTFNKTPFLFATNIEAEQEQEFEPPIAVNPGSELDVTLLVDLGSWFLDDTGTALLDPSTASKGSATQRLVDQNIRRSFRAFRDDDRDGTNDD